MNDTHHFNGASALLAALLLSPGCAKQGQAPRANEGADAGRLERVPGAEVRSSKAAAEPALVEAEEQRSCVACELPGWDFSGRTLSGINLLDANLRGANFSGATLRGVDLSGAELEGADFSGARIEALEGQPTRFTRAKLSKARFVKASFDAADLQYATIDCADFSEANMSGVIVGRSLDLGSSRCAERFTDAVVSGEIADYGAALDLRGAKLPARKGAQAELASSGWQCPNVDVTQLDAVVYVAPSGTDGSTCGSSSSSPCKTLGGAVARCSGSQCAVLAYYGSYAPTSPVELKAGVSIYGGCLSSTPNSSYVSIVNAPGGGAPAFVANGVSSARLQGLSVVGSAAADGAGSPSVAIALSGGSAVAFSHVTVTGGAGGRGQAGQAGGSRQAGGGASGQAGGGNGSCDAGGGNGGVGMTTHVDYTMTKVTNCPSQCTENGCDGYHGGGPAGGSGGSQRGAYCALSCISSCGDLNGYAGGRGSDGACGAGGVASTDVFGGYVNGVWEPTTSGAGQAGGDGSGGGGGGGGTACGYVCFWVPANKSGGHGGGGGAGGCGATQGGGGQQGGASIAVQVVGSTVEFEGVTITAGRGGGGGDGGKGGAAVSGGAGGGGERASGASPVAGSGGPGGQGGWGASSGGGAGGNGGPSYGVVFVGSTQTGVAQDTVFMTGYSDGVGNGAETSLTPGAPCSSAKADNGKPGKVGTVISFTDQG